jgi:hypothetical protein
MINAIGAYLPQTPGSERISPTLRSRLYRFAFDRGNLDSLLDEYIVRPFVLVFEWSDRMEQRWTAWLSGPAKSMGETTNGDARGNGFEVITDAKGSRSDSVETS